ncbi:helix-turn-helix domain-containing protein [Leucobacter chromiireducens]|nr:helix-turn-helix transcriptional regulator [Leucobacter chromiireducens]
MSDPAAEILKQILASNLRSYRKGRGISQSALAHELELDTRYYSGIERGEWNLTFETVGNIADRLGLHPLDLITGHEPPPEDDE